MSGDTRPKPRAPRSDSPRSPNGTPTSGKPEHRHGHIDRSRIEHAIAAAAPAAESDAAYLVAFTDSGATVRLVSRMRPPGGIPGSTASDRVFRRSALRCGVRRMRNHRFLPVGHDADRAPSNDRGRYG